MAKRTAALGTRAFAPSGVEGAAVSDVILQDGSRAFTADQSMGGNQLTNVGDGSAVGDAVNLGQLQAGVAAAESYADGVASAAQSAAEGTAATALSGVTGGTAAVNPLLLTVRSAAPAAPAAGKAYAYVIDYGTPTEGALLHCDGDNDGTTFTDEVGHNFTAVSGAVTKTAVKKFGTTSMYLPGTDDAITSATDDDWKPGTGDWTFDAWVLYPSSLGAQQILFQIGKDSAGYRSMMLGFSSGYLMQVYLSTDGSWNIFNAAVGDLGTNASLLQVGMWNHVRWVRNGYEILGFMNNQLCSRWRFGSAPTANPVYDADTGGAGRQTCTIGAARKSDDSYYLGFTGYVDEVRWVKGAAVFPNGNGPTRAYPVPTLSIEDSDGTVSRLLSV